MPPVPDPGYFPDPHPGQPDLRHRTITLQTTDSSDPVLVLKNIKDSRAVKDLLSDLIEKERVSKGIAGREIMVNSGMGEDFDGDGEIDFDDYR